MLGRGWGTTTLFVLLALLRATAATAVTYEEGDAAFHKRDYETALRHWQPLAEAGDVRAQLGVGQIYYGGLGVVLNYELAFLWCNRAADQGEPNAQYILGALYRDGKGTERDMAKAVAFFQKAGNQGVAGAQYNLGLLYLTGELGPPNLVEAYYWLGLAATAQGNDHAQMRATAAYARDQAGSKLSPQQITEVKDRISASPTAPPR